MIKVNSYHIVVGALFGVVLAVAVPTAWAQVDLNGETHFRCYIVSQQTPQAATTVTLDDQFLEETLTVNEPLQFCAPVSKDGAIIDKPEEHLTMYGAAANLLPHLTISTEDQFGERTLEAVGARVLLVPTQKLAVDGTDTGLIFPGALNHSWCYEVTGDRVDEAVSLEDQFREDEEVRVERPRLFCNPVSKAVEGSTTIDPPEPEVHLTCYEIKAPQRTQATAVEVFNQFEEDTFKITASELLCVPSAKLSFEPVP